MTALRFQSLTKATDDFSVLNGLFDIISHTTICSIEVFVSASPNVPSSDVLQMAWKTIRAVPPTIPTINVGISATCLQCLLSDGRVGQGANWPFLIDILQNQSSYLTVRFWEWAASPQTMPQMTDPFATPDTFAVPPSYELQNALRPCSGPLRTSLISGLARQMGLVTIGAYVEIM